MNRAMTKTLTHKACPVIITGRMIKICSMVKHAVRLLLGELHLTYLIKL
jgi:hypothetical protein